MLGCLSEAEARAWLNEAEQVAAARPVRVVFAAHDDPCQPGESLSVNGVGYPVLRVLEARFQGVAVARILVLG